MAHGNATATIGWLAYTFVCSFRGFMTEWLEDGLIDKNARLISYRSGGQKHNVTYRHEPDLSDNV